MGIFTFEGQAATLTTALRGQIVDRVEACGEMLNIITSDKPVYAVGASVLLTNENGQLLLAKRKNNSGAGLLSTPGGRVEYSDESALAAAEREFEEECGAKLVEPIIIGCKKHFRFGKHYFMFYVHASVWFGDIKNCIPDKSEDWAWFDVDDLSAQNCTEPSYIISLLLNAGHVWPQHLAL